MESVAAKNIRRLPFADQPTVLFYPKDKDKDKDKDNKKTKAKDFQPANQL